MTTKQCLLNLLVLPAVAIALMAVAPANLPAAEKELVSYRAREWQTVEFEDAAKAKTHLETLKTIGCEVKQEPHDGHTDIHYRCPDWRQMSLKTHKDAHDWEQWLKASGFETRHEH